MIIERSSQFSCLMSFQRTTKLIPVDTQMVEQYSRHGVRVTKLTPSQRCSLLLFLILSYSLTMTFAFQFYLAAPLSIFLAIFTAFLLVYILPALSFHIFMKIQETNLSNSTNHQWSRSSRRKRFRGCRQFESENTGISNAMFPWFQHRAWLWVGSNSNNRPSTTQHWSKCWHCDKGPATWLWRGWTLGPANIFNIGTGK